MHDVLAHLAHLYHMKAQVILPARSWETAFPTPSGLGCIAAVQVGSRSEVPRQVESSNLGTRFWLGARYSQTLHHQLECFAPWTALTGGEASPFCTHGWFPPHQPRTTALMVNAKPSRDTCLIGNTLVASRRCGQFHGPRPARTSE